ncbi:hypothetical protein Q4519_17615 [Motilimonas sp. 1_MG-2023]|uniref:hypothetical protein n=1 Tax=Motilimonas sp. 1_MG-2023 TaxID=3062672 RepID=UPI0026E19063|nr:hypothetical protein [Motilimonas sp. 1_MG-2023]MDO6527501.1 hypothetical protein [Motilimonas sp. 1_MG-2023]
MGAKYRFEVTEKLLDFTTKEEIATVISFPAQEPTADDLDWLSESEQKNQGYFIYRRLEPQKHDTLLTI